MVVKFFGERMPTAGTRHSAGLDLYASEPVVIPSNSMRLVKTGLTWECEPGHFGLIRDRSGLALKHKLFVAAGVIDADYRGEIGVVMWNFGETAYSVAPGDRVAQMIILKYEMNKGVEILNGNRQGGFGSTGV